MIIVSSKLNVKQELILGSSTLLISNKVLKNTSKRGTTIEQTWLILVVEDELRTLMHLSMYYVPSLVCN